jgi:hypothetical protein
MKAEQAMRKILDRIHPLQEQLEALIADPDTARQRLPYAFDSLRDVLLSLKVLQACLEQSPLDMDACSDRAGGLGRLILEYTEISDSDLGKQLLQLASDVIKLARATSQSA